jgi:molybdopterin converting factor small subunit
MAVVRIPSSLRQFSAGKAEVRVTGNVLSAVLSDLEQKCPGISERLFDDKGGLRRFLNVYVGDEDVRFSGQLQTPVKDSDEVSIIPAIAGG